ncbi:MAG: peptide chain release factor N(5)-glutamine methyltransferase [Spirochaetales bacterium]|nr:MAG: peptide chain release factor N(5)-glutamine methyltransferase [Spirochaetales bacterium]
MTLREAIAEGAGALEAGRPGSPFLDASLLMAQALGVGRDAVLARLPEGIPPDALLQYRGFIQRRLAGEPVAYILGYREFYGRRFRVDHRVLVPRPDTELLVEVALALLPAPRGSDGGPPIRVHDAFAGSGCVGISLAAERPDIELSMSDASTDALAVCARNCRTLLGREAAMLAGDILSAASAPLDLITANPPYVTSSFTDDILSNGSVEPRSALDGGNAGLDLYAPLAVQAAGLLRAGGYLVVEIGEEQGRAVADILRNAGFTDIGILQDLAGRDRVVRGEMP